MPPNDKPRLYDYAGRRVRTSALKRDMQIEGMAMSRGYWYESFYRYLTPTYLAYILYESRNGYQLDRLLSLAEEMEEVDTHYAGVLRARKRATTKLPLTIDANGAKPDIAEVSEKLIREPLVRKGLRGMLDALGKGYSVTEIMWGSSASGWEPRELRWRDPRYFGFNSQDHRTIELRRDASNPEPLTPFKFIYHQPELKSGLPARNGLARLCAWTWIYKLYSIKDWMDFLQIYGLPIRVGRYKRNTQEADIEILKDQIADLGHDAAAVIPEDADIEFVELKNASGQADVFENSCRYWDESLSKAIIGQTMTSESGGSLAQAKVHMQVAHDITEGDAEDLGITLSEQLLQPWVQLNYGAQERYPLTKFSIPERPGENVDDEGQPAGDGKGSGNGGKKPADDGMNAIRQRIRTLGLNAVDAGVGSELDALAIDYLRGWRKQLAPIKEDLDALAAEANSYEDFREGLGGLYAQWAERDATFIDSLGEAGFLAAGLGASE